MNRYQLELLEMDRRRVRNVRLVSSLAAATLIVAAMWAAGIPSKGWFAWMLDKESANHIASAVHEDDVSETSTMPPKSESSSVLRLISTSPGRNSREGSAQISSGSTNPLTYGAGAILENGTTLLEIHSDHVVLARGEEASALYVGGAARSLFQRDGKAVGPALETLDHTASVVSTTIAVAEVFTEIVRAAPRFEDDAIVGFDVFPGTSSGHFSQLGLRRGDLLLAIDGLPITDVDSLNASLKNIAEGRSAVASVLRAGEEITLSLDGAVIRSPTQAIASAQAEP